MPPDGNGRGRHRGSPGRSAVTRPAGASPGRPAIAAAIASAIAGRPVIAAAIVAAAIVSLSAPAAADVTASGSVGAGVFAGQAASTAEVGVDAAGIGYAVGLGAGARFLAEDGFRGQEWDEASEWVRVVRYALLRRGDPPGDGGEPDAAWVAAAVGELGGVTLGHGALIDGFAGGLDVDHGRVGVQVSAGRGDLVGELVVDDVVAPRIAGARVAMRPGGRAVLGVSAAGDRAAPSMEEGEEAIGGVAIDGELGGVTDGGGRGALHADLVHLVGLGVGLHIGARGLIELGESLRVGGGAELRAGSDHYLPGWIGPLYERDRRQLGDDDAMAGQLDAARAGGLGGIGVAGQLTAEVPDRVDVSLGYAGRPGLADLVTARVAAPHRAGAQVALWAAAEVEGRAAEAMALAFELRVRLPGRWFVRGDVARLYREGDDGSFAPIWLGQVALGSMLGGDSSRH